MKSSLVYIIVLNWNGKKLLEDCLNSLMKLEYNNYKVLLVDNASTDGSVDYVKTKFSNVETIILDKNYGFAGGNNKGFEYAKNRNAEFVIFLNNDTSVKPNFLHPLITPFKNDQVGQTVPKIFYADHPAQIWYAGGKVNFWTGQIYHEGIRDSESEKYCEVKETDYATGCCFCMRTEDFDLLNGFDESYKMYGEDTDLSLRIRQGGQKVYFIPASNIYHKVSASLGGTLSMKKLRRKFGSNIILMFRYAKFYQWVTEIISMPFLLLLGIIKYFRLHRDHQVSSL